MPKLPLIFACVVVVMSAAGPETSGQANTPSSEAQAVVPRAVQLQVPAYGRSQSAPLTVRGGEIVVVRAAQPGELAPAIFVYDHEKRLLAKNSEDSGRVFEWTANDDGVVSLVFYSNSDLVLGYSVEVLPPARTRAAPPKPSSHAIVRVLFATDRKLNSRRPMEFSSEPDDANRLSYGTCYVSVPRDHRMGDLEGPSIWRLEFSADPDRHITVVSAELSDQSTFFDQVRRLALRSDAQDALVFIHGYNNSFDDAARRTAQIAYDLGFKGPTVLFSWPSQGTLPGYNKDATNVELSVPALQGLLVDLSRVAGVKRIHVIAHSMGNRALVRALARIGPENPIRQVALLAPDIDAGLFRQLAREFPKTIGPVALYASSRDTALEAAGRFAGYPRAGQGGRNIVIVPGMETIDASNVDTSLAGLRHQYYGDASQILSDLFSFFLGNPASKRFGLRPARSSPGEYWTFAPIAR